MQGCQLQDQGRREKASPKCGPLPEGLVTEALGRMCSTSSNFGHQENSFASWKNNPGDVSGEALLVHWGFSVSVPTVGRFKYGTHICRTSKFKIIVPGVRVGSFSEGESVPCISLNL